MKMKWRIKNKGIDSNLVVLEKHDEEDSLN